MTARAALVSLLLAATCARAQTGPANAVPEEGRWRKFAVPAVEGLSLHFAFLAFSNLFTRMPFAQVSPETIENHFAPRAWAFDEDYYVTNQIGHPYQGALHFTAARSMGLSFWWSALYATLGSLVWELAFEVDRPSLNDQLTTSIGGAFLGEALHRSARRLRESNPSWVRGLAATLLDPMGALNRELFGTALDVDEDESSSGPAFVQLQLGANTSAVLYRQNQPPLPARPRGVLFIELVSGRAIGVRPAPFSYFDLRGDLSFPDWVGNLFIRGTLTSAPFKHGVWGLFGVYDYSAPAIVRASAVGVGPGGIAQYPLGPRLVLQLGGVLAASPFGAAGQLLEVSPDLERDYHIGPGVQTSLEAKLVLPRWFRLEALLHNWWIFGLYTAATGFESITYLTGAATVVLGEWLGVGAEIDYVNRRARFGMETAQRDVGISIHLKLCVLSDSGFGVVAR